MAKVLTENSSATLDLIRGISAQLVVIGHGVSFCGVAVSLRQPNFPWMQNIAVVIFFILSGFLISHSLVRKRNKNYNVYHYIADRFSRIYVTFIPAILLVLLIDILSLKINSELYRHNSALNIETFVGNILMLQDYPIINYVTSFGSARPFWTLAIEWWIYLFVGISFFTLKKKQAISKLDVVYILFLSIVPIYNFFGGRGNGLTLYWVYGALAFYLWQKSVLKPISLTKLLFLLVTSLIAASYTVMKTMQEYEPFFALCLAFTILLLIEISSKVKISSTVRSCCSYLASFSYTLYLLHYSIYDLLVTQYGGGYRIFIIGFIISNIVSCFLGRFFEITLTKAVKNLIYSILNNNKNITSASI